MFEQRRPFDASPTTFRSDREVGVSRSLRESAQVRCKSEADCQSAARVCAHSPACCADGRQGTSQSAKEFQRWDPLGFISIAILAIWTLLLWSLVFSDKESAGSFNVYAFGIYSCSWANPGLVFRRVWSRGFAAFALTTVAPIVCVFGLIGLAGRLGRTGWVLLPIVLAALGLSWKYTDELHRRATNPLGELKNYWSSLIARAS